tara:strand:+ start:410 stop:1369 length:960 start_codon:yes stop_codon:yes gene_type:complete
MNLINLYKKILRIRKIETKISEEYSKGKMRCPVHLSIGQEAPAVGICSNLNANDQILSSHRSHAHYLAKGGNLKKMLSEIYGKKNGSAKGKGGSMHLSDLNAGIIASVPIVGSTLPIATGVAWSNKIQKKNNVVVIFFGDGATEEGVFQESLDFASLHDLKILFVCENNFYSVYSPLKYRQSDKRNIINFTKSLGLDSYQLDGNDVVKIYSSSKKIISRIKKRNRPAFLYLNTYRWLEHCGPNYDDNLGYRTKNEINFWKKNCPLKNILKIIRKQKVLTNNSDENIKKAIDMEITAAFNHAEKSKFPNRSELNRDIYAK